MDQKRAMLYPDIDPAAHSAATRDHRISASTAMGLPTEAPPSYDMAIASTSTAPNAPILESASVGDGNGIGAGGSSGGAAVLGWHPNAPTPAAAAAAASAPVIRQQPQAPIPPVRQQRTAPQPTMLPHENQTRPVIVVQPLPHNQQQAQAPTIRTANTSVDMKLGPHPCAVTCPVCGANKTTRMVYTPNTRTHICAGLLCLAGFCCCACMVPYCMNSCRTGNHYCSQCNTFLGVYSPGRARKLGRSSYVS